MENGPFMDDFPIETSISEGFSMAMLNNQMVTINYDTGWWLTYHWLAIYSYYMVIIWLMIVNDG